MSRGAFIEQLLKGAPITWTPLGTVTEYEQPTKYIVKSSEYKDEYATPVLTAGKTFVLGHTNEEFGIYEGSKHPVIIFDDFTTANKWVDFDFKVKSSAMKLITSKADNNVLLKYIYYWLNTLPEGLNDGDHRRRWISTFSHKLIPVPCPENPEKSLAIQAKIVRTLDTFSALTSELTSELNKRQKQYNYYRDLLLNFEKDEVEWKALGEIGTWYGGGTPSKRRPDYWEGGTIPWVSPKDMGRSVINSSIDSITPLALKESSAKLVPKSSVLMVVRSSILERVFPSAFVPIEVSINQDMKAIIPHEGILPKYLAHLVSSRGNAILRAARRTGGSVASIDSRKLFTFRIPVPGLEEQARIVAILDQFDTLTQSLTEGLPREIELRQKQYEYYRDLLFDFPRPESARAAAEA